MDNKTVGYLVIGIAGLIGLIVFLFNQALNKIVSTACTHGPSCPMWGTIEFQTNVGIGMMLFVVAIGLYLIMSDKKKNAVKREYGDIMKSMKKDEKAVFENVIENDGSIFQSELAKKTGMSKVKVTRILDKLEGKGLVERKRRGMTNVIILKQ